MFKHEQGLVNKVFMLYAFQVGLLNKLLLLLWCVTCTRTELPQGPVQSEDLKFHIMSYCLPNVTCQILHFCEREVKQVDIVF